MKFCSSSIVTYDRKPQKNSRGFSISSFFLLSSLIPLLSLFPDPYLPEAHSPKAVNCGIYILGRNTNDKHPVRIMRMLPSGAESCRHKLLISKGGAGLAVE